MANTFRDIIQQLENQKAAIDRALLALREVGHSENSEIEVTAKAAGAKRGPQRKRSAKRTMSAEARKLISDAQKKRWAASGAKKATKKKAIAKRTGSKAATKSA